MAELSLQFEWDPGCSCCLLSANTWERIVAADSILQLQQAPLVIAANNQPMNVLGKLVDNIQLPNNTTFKWQFIVVKNITADGFIGSVTSHTKINQSAWLKNQTRSWSCNIDILYFETHKLLPISSASTHNLIHRILKGHSGHFCKI